MRREWQIKQLSRKELIDKEGHRTVSTEADPPEDVHDEHESHTETASQVRGSDQSDTMPPPTVHALRQEMRKITWEKSDEEF
jgi:hypothetical protein